MKLSLVVLTPGKMEGKVIPITLSQFVIGRDPQCHLRPNSAVISKRHCAVLIRGNKAYVRDFDSTNGTFVNDQPVKGEVELQLNDQLKVGPLLFRAQIEETAAVNRPTPPPPTKKPAATTSNDDESIAAMLLAVEDGGSPSRNSSGEDVPEGSTVMEISTPTATEGKPNETDKKKEAEKSKSSIGSRESTSNAAKSILEKYMRRPRSER